MEAYLDNSATTRCSHAVCEIVQRVMAEDYGNPSSMHRKGVEAERYVKEAAARIAATLKVSEKEIYFTSGGTESDNWALFGAAMANRRRGNHIIISDIEHPAVSEPANRLSEQGFTVTRLPVDAQGCVRPEELKAAMTPRTILVSVMYVNNEIGSVQPIEAIGQFLKTGYPGTLFHVDAIQAYGKYRIYPKRLGIDLLSVSGHKIHGPKGVGFLYVGKGTKLSPVMFGGGQQEGMRSGTDNVPGIAGLGLASALCYQEFEQKRVQMYARKHQLLEGLQEMERVVIHGMEEEAGAPHIVNASFLGVRSEVLLHALEEKQIYVSAGSACATHKRSKSPTLTAIGAGAEAMESSIRFSISEETKAEEIEAALTALRELLPMLRRYMRR